MIAYPLLMPGREKIRPLLHYIVSLVLIGFYGDQVCPFLESLTLLQLLIPTGLVLAVAYLARPLLHRRLIDEALYQQQTYRVFWLEFLLLVAVGVFLMLFNRQFYGFPLGSGMKLVLAMSTLGFFLAIDLALAQERVLTELFWRQKIDLDPEHGYFPLPRKMAIFATASCLFVVGILYLLINKDLNWQVTVGDKVSLADGRRSILVEISFVLAVILAHLLNLIVSFTRNLHTFFNNENTVLKAATNGRLDGVVPVSSNDEFGVMAKHTNLMITGLREMTLEVQQTRDVTIMTLASLAETRDNETGAHLLRTQCYIKALAQYLRTLDEFAARLDDETVDLLFKSAPLHDIGKVGIPDRILLKPGKLTDEEFTIMKSHAALGGDALRVAEERLGSNSFLRVAREIAYGHHEKWDGSGYPLGLKGGDIPLSGRLMALADVYDALITQRVYKPAFSHTKARAIIIEGRGTHFDPRVIDAFVAVEEEFVNIAHRFVDSQPVVAG